jgi:signal transduction histidine kinase
MLRFVSGVSPPLLVRAIPVGVFAGGLLVSLLLFELVRAQARARVRAEQRTRAMGEQVQFAETLVGIVSHDLRNPLNVIQLNATLLERSPLREELVRCVHRIQSSSAMSLRLIRDLLDFTQARVGGGIPVVRSPGDIIEIVQQTLDEARIAHPHRRFALDVMGDGSGTWDADRIAQLMSNLLNNALVYGAASSPITVAVHGGDTRVQLRIHNEGEPIAPDVQAALFEPLRQGPSRAGVAQRNIGLGLYIVQEIARAHGGSVSLESADGAGTSFIVDLPRAPSMA